MGPRLGLRTGNETTLASFDAGSRRTKDGGPRSRNLRGGASQEGNPQTSSEESWVRIPQGPQTTALICSATQKPLFCSGEMRAQIGRLEEIHTASVKSPGPGKKSCPNPSFFQP